MAVPPNDSNSLVGLPNLSDSKQMMYTSTDDSISIDDNHLGSASNGELQSVEICSNAIQKYYIKYFYYLSHDLT